MSTVYATRACAYAKRAGEVVSDFCDKVSNSTSRAGHGVERINKLDKAGVPHAAIAGVMSNNSRNDFKWTEREVAVLCKFHKDSVSGPVVTKKQANALIKDQKESLVPEGLVAQG